MIAMVEIPTLETDRLRLRPYRLTDFDAYATRGIRLERTQTLAGGASHCNFRFSRLQGEEAAGTVSFCPTAPA